MLLNYHIGRFVLVSLCVGDLGLSSISVAACNTDTTQTPRKNANYSL